MNNFNQQPNQGQPQYPQPPQQYAPYPQPNPPQPPQKKKMKKWQIALIVVGVIVAIGIVGGSGDTEDTTPSTSVETSATESNKDTSSSKADENKTDESKADEDKKDTSSSKADEDKKDTSSKADIKGEEKTVYNVGEVLDTDKLKVTYQSVEDFTNFDEYFPPADGKKIIRAYFVMENVSKNDQYVSAYEFSCYADGASAEEYIWNSDDMLDTTTISSGRKAEGYVYYEVPVNAEKIEIEYETSFWTEDKVIFVVK